MKLGLFRSLWGLVRADGGRQSVADTVAQTASSRYMGVECSLRLAHDLQQGEDLLILMKESSLSWIPILFTSGPVNGWSPGIPSASCTTHGAPAQHHVDALARQVEAAQELASTHQVPIHFFNAHSGHDSFTEGAAVEYLEKCARLEQDLGVKIVHEIHRGRIFSNPWATARLVQRSPEVKLIADYSHFTTASEVEPWDPFLLPALEQLTPHIAHIHARVGYENGPQVPDPRCPSWQPYTHAFEALWSRIWQHHISQGASLVTATPEYGPPTYQQVQPFTDRVPVADIAEVNAWTAGRLQAVLAEVASRTADR